MKKDLEYRVIIESDTRTGTNEPAFTAYVPTLGLATDGETIDQAFANAKEAIEAFIGSLIEDGLDIPKESSEQFLVKTARVIV